MLKLPMRKHWNVSSYKDKCWILKNFGVLNSSSSGRGAEVDNNLWNGRMWRLRETHQAPGSFRPRQILCLEMFVKKPCRSSFNVCQCGDSCGDRMRRCVESGGWSRAFLPWAVGGGTWQGSNFTAALKGKMRSGREKENVPLTSLLFSSGFQRGRDSGLGEEDEPIIEWLRAVACWSSVHGSKDAH